MAENPIEHRHPHVHTNTKAVQNRLAKAAGQLERVMDMVERQEDCADVLQQLSAVIGALRSASRIIMRDHLEHCLAEAREDGDTEAIDRFREAVELYMK